MKKIVTVIAIAILTVGTIFASNNNTASVNKTNNTEVTATANTTSTIVITICDMNGKVVYTESISNDDNNQNIKLNINNKLAKGTYIVTLVVDNNKMSQKLVVE